MNADDMMTDVFEADRVWHEPEAIYRPTMPRSQRVAWACFLAIALGLALAAILVPVMM